MKKRVIATMQRLGKEHTGQTGVKTRPMVKFEETFEYTNATINEAQLWIARHASNPNCLKLEVEDVPE